MVVLALLISEKSFACILFVSMEAQLCGQEDLLLPVMDSDCDWFLPELSLGNCCIVLTKPTRIPSTFDDIRYSL